MHWQCGHHTIDLTTPVIMGVLNVTPDSFSDGGQYCDVSLAAAHGEQMLREGAAIIDVGGESTRPGAKAVSIQQELDRVIPVVEALAKLNAVISIDTSQPEVMQAAILQGAAIVNDVRALTLPGALDVIAQHAVGVCLMHMRGEPATMQDNIHYDDVSQEVLQFLLQRAQACQQLGVRSERIVIDPGFGFGKTVADNLKLVKQLHVFAEQNYPVLIGVSRKSTIGKVLEKTVDERLIGSLALTVMAVANGAKIIRTHDVAATKEAVTMAAETLYDN